MKYDICPACNKKGLHQMKVKTWYCIRITKQEDLPSYPHQGKSYRCRYCHRINPKSMEEMGFKEMEDDGFRIWHKIITEDKLIELTMKE